jgi:hypothetical protein
MKIVRKKSYSEAMKVAHHFLKSGREVRIGKRKGDTKWEVRIAARK